MNKYISLILLALFPALFISCKTDFDVTAEYKEVAIVYGLLNQKDSIQYLRINKAFLGEGNSLVYAQIADSSSFGKNIDVVLTETNELGIKRDIVFDTVTLFNKESGVFYSPGQLFYSSTEKLDQNSAYELKITNSKTGLEVTSSTNLIHNFNFTKPSSGSKTISFKRSFTQPMKFAWKNAVNGKRYQMRLHFNFTELSPAGDSTHRKITWTFPESVTEKIDGTGESEAAYTNAEFYTFCEANIPYTDQSAEDAVVKRFAANCDLEVTVAGDEFSTYLDANGPTTGVLIDKPVYSNILNGLGLFSCRYQIVKSILLSPETILDLSTTTTLKFAKPN